jgi:HD-GYP domain-containing protein (c-di-GMP phosphodiesterase class II)
VANGQRAGEAVSVRPGEALSVGRSGESDLQLLDLGVSRFHCVVEDQADGLVVTDLSSRNGTFVNGERIKRQSLDEGDEIGIGTARVVVERLSREKRFGLTCLFTERGGTETRRVHCQAAPETGVLDPANKAGEERRVARYLAALYKINDAIDAETSIASVMTAVMDTVLRVIRAERGFLLLAESETGELRPQVIRVAAGSGADPDLPVSLPVVRESMATGASVLCPDLLADERRRDGDRLLLDHIRSVLCAPLHAGGRVVGALYLDTSSDRAPFDEHDADLLTAIARQAGHALHRAQLVDDLERLFLGAIETLVATVEAKDIYTYGHSARVSKLARGIAEGMGLSDDEQEKIKTAGLLHDIGKIGIPESVLSKPGRLTEEEWGYIRSHPQIGESIIRQMGTKRLAGLCPYVRHHHERLDGSGYPDGLEGHAVPLGARILAVADAYDAMTSNRPYRDPFSSEEAIAELRRNAGQQFDAQAVEALVELRSERRADVVGARAEGR